MSRQTKLEIDKPTIVSAVNTLQNTRSTEGFERERERDRQR